MSYISSNRLIDCTEMRAGDVIVARMHRVVVVGCGEPRPVVVPILFSSTPIYDPFLGMLLSAVLHKYFNYQYKPQEYSVNPRNRTSKL